MSSKQGTYRIHFNFVTLDLFSFLGQDPGILDLGFWGFFFSGGKAKPLKQPKADKKEYDEVLI